MPKEWKQINFMSKKFLYFIIPIAVLTGFYFTTKKKELHGDFERKLISNTGISQTDKITIPGIVDGITLDNRNLWINQRFNILKYNADPRKQVLLKGNYGAQGNPIVNLFVENDSVFYYQGNTPTINFVNLNVDSIVRYYKLLFPISYFIKSKDNSFLFQENVPKNVYSQIHYQDFKSGTQKINTNVFSHETGSGIRYSGSFLSTQDKKYLFFVSFYDNYIYCMDYKGDLKYKIKAVDSQDQTLEIIKEDQVYYLSPKANILRLSACIYNDKLLVASKVRASNQSEEGFKKNSTIDVYNVEDGKYQYSFYLPKFYNIDPSNMVVSQAGLMYANYGSTILTYQLKL